MSATHANTPAGKAPLVNAVVTNGRHSSVSRCVPASPRCSHGAERALLRTPLDRRPERDTVLGEQSVRRHQTALREPCHGRRPLVVRPGAGRLGGGLGEALPGRRVGDQCLDAAQVGSDQCGDVAVTAVLAEQGERVEEHHVRLVRPGQVGVRRVERAAGDGAPVGRRTGQVGGLRDLVGDQRLLAEESGPRGRDAAVAGSHHVLRARCLPRRGDEVRDQRRVEHVEGRGHRPRADAPHRRRARGEVGGAPLAHPDAGHLRLDLGGEVAQGVQGLQQAGSASGEARIHASFLPCAPRPRAGPSGVSARARSSSPRSSPTAAQGSRRSRTGRAGPPVRASRGRSPATRRRRR